MKPMGKKNPVHNKNFDIHGKKPPTLKNIKIAAIKILFG